MTESRARVIVTDNLTREFSGRAALTGVSLAVQAGTVFGLLGPNGAGKTTTIRLLLGLLEPTTGSSRVLGFDPIAQGSEVRQRSGALLEHNGLYERLSAYENLEFYARIYRLSPAQRVDRIRQLLTRFDLWDRRHDIVVAWSRGMKQKLAIARAMLHDPDLLFLDEPTAGLDPIAAAAFRDDLARVVADEKVTVFLTTHHLGEAERLCSSVAILKEGRIVAAGTPRDIERATGQPTLEAAFLALFREARP